LYSGQYLIMYAAAVTAFAIFLWGVFRRYRAWTLGAGRLRDRMDQAGVRFLRLLKGGVGQVEVARERLPGWSHVAIVAGFAIFAVGTLTIAVQEHLQIPVFRGRVYLFESLLMDLMAVLEPTECTEYLQTTGKQHCAFEYGSAFSRAARSIMPAGDAVYVSGTASIDAEGATTHLGDAAGQIDATIENVRAVLKEMQCGDNDVVQVIAYCKTIEVEKVFNTRRDSLDWPWITVICDICRPDLLFEIEAIAMPKQGS